MKQYLIIMLSFLAIFSSCQNEVKTEEPTAEAADSTEEKAAE